MTASQKRGTIYIGVTNDLGRRIPEHKHGNGSGFTKRYGVDRLVWYEEHFDVRDAIQREKSLKRWRRQWKIELIEKTNPEWPSYSAAEAGETAATLRVFRWPFGQCSGGAESSSAAAPADVAPLRLIRCSSSSPRGGLRRRTASARSACRRRAR
jgi:putative endonuclease